MFKSLFALTAICVTAYDAETCIFTDPITPPYGYSSKGSLFSDYTNLTYFEGDGHQLFLKTLVMCSDASAAFVGIRSSFSSLDSTNDTVTQTFMQMPAGKVTAGSANCQTININVAAGEYITNINLLVNKTVNAISFMKVTTSKSQTIAKGPAPKTPNAVTQLTFNSTYQPVGFFGTESAASINSIGVLTTDSNCYYSQFFVDAAALLAAAEGEAVAEKKKTDAIIGGVVGGVLGLGLIIGIVFLVLWIQKKNRIAQESGQELNLFKGKESTKIVQTQQSNSNMDQSAIGFEDIDRENAMKKKTENDFPSNTNEEIVDAMTSYPRNGKNK